MIHRKNKYLYSIFLLLFISFYLIAQNDPPKQRKYDENTYITRFLPIHTAKTYQKSHFTFPNINIISHYKSDVKINLIHRLILNKKWEELYDILYEYINNFGIKNFFNEYDMDLLWRFARLSEYFSKISITKEAYRLIIKHYRGDLQETLYHYDSLIKFEKDLYVELDYYYELVERRRAIDTLRPPSNVLLNMGNVINSEYEDYAPAISGENNDLILFSSDRNRDTLSINIGLEGNLRNEDIYQSKKDETGTWKEVLPFERINSPYNEGSPCISRDKKTLFFVRCKDPKSLGNCDIYESDLKEDNHWSEAINLGTNINSRTWDSHPSLSFTGDTLYFASDREGGFGGSDIFFSVKNKHGKWDKAKNLGPIINTQKDELSPHYHSEYNLLYFSSNGQLLNFGDFDIFKSYLINNRWTEPKNVGPLVNTKGREYYLVPRK